MHFYPQKITPVISIVSSKDVEGRQATPLKRELAHAPQPFFDPSDKSELGFTFSNISFISISFFESSNISGI